jgi:predicted  nucleic acid-binding Zn-ribbon protein
LLPALHTARAEDAKASVSLTLSQFDNEFHSLRVTLARSMASLQSLKAAANENADLNKPYTEFSTAYSDLESQVTKVREHGTAAKARAKEHYEAWQKELTQMQNASLREKAQKRYTATSGEFEKINEKVSEAKEDFAPLAADLKDIYIYLKTDLSKEAVSSLSNTIWKMGIKARSVDGKLDDVCKQIQKVMKKMPQA